MPAWDASALRRQPVRSAAVAVVVGALFLPVTGSASATTTEQVPGAQRGIQQSVRHDVTFLAMFLPHHQSAVQLASVAGQRATNTEVRRLAAHIVQVQSRQMRQMQTWLTDHHAKPMPPPPAVQEMNRQNLYMLREARGAQVDRLFLTLMRMHHAQGLSETADELQHGRDTFALHLARTAYNAQAGELSEMNQLLTPCTGRPSRGAAERVGAADAPGTDRAPSLSCRPITG